MLGFRTQCYLSFFESIDMPGYYFMIDYSPKHAHELYEKFTRTGRYDETGMTETYGYQRENVKRPLCFQLPDSLFHFQIQLNFFIMENKLADRLPYGVNSQFGWFKFNEEINIEKWVQDFYDRGKKYEEEKRNSGKGEIIQTSLF